MFLDIPRDLPIVLATNNPKKATIFSENGFHLKGFEPIIVQPTVHTRHHLKAKQEQLEHILGLADAIGDTAGEPVSVSQPTLNSDVFRKIQSTCEQKNTILCCGLDPDLKRLPKSLVTERSPEMAVSEFLYRIVDITHPFVCAYKIQKAFFDQLEGGLAVLKDVVKIIRAADPRIFVIVDCKIGDIDNTMQAYLTSLLVVAGADAVVLKQKTFSELDHGTVDTLRERSQGRDDCGVRSAQLQQTLVT